MSAISKEPKEGSTRVSSGIASGAVASLDETTTPDVSNEGDASGNPGTYLTLIIVTGYNFYI